jgi:hypothetical protein
MPRTSTFRSDEGSSGIGESIEDIRPYGRRVRTTYHDNETDKNENSATIPLNIHSR